MLSGFCGSAPPGDITALPIGLVERGDVDWKAIATWLQGSAEGSELGADPRESTGGTVDFLDIAQHSVGGLSDTSQDVPCCCHVFARRSSTRRTPSFSAV